MSDEKQHDPEPACEPEPLMRARDLMPDPRIHRSQAMRCATCMWFAAKVPLFDPINPLPPPPTTRIGRCRRHAPTMGGYPVVFQADWCGDHKLDENKQRS